MLIEYEVLAELGIEPMRAELVPAAIADAIGHLVLKGLATNEQRTVTITDRGRQLLEVGPVSQTPYTVAFDYRHLGWNDGTP
ncbi:hypothetical protein VT03_03685 [Planctomyces sp. SH-PL14]|nr:hypothetical protein VT03_03685 [Planctomyces sp. SH-PL14]